MTTLENFYFGNINPSDYEVKTDVKKQYSVLWSIFLSCQIMIRQTKKKAAKQLRVHLSNDYCIETFSHHQKGLENVLL